MGRRERSWKDPNSTESQSMIKTESQMMEERPVTQKTVLRQWDDKLEINSLCVNDLNNFRWEIRGKIIFIYKHNIYIYVHYIFQIQTYHAHCPAFHLFSLNYTHIHAHTYIYTQTHTCTHIHTHMHTYIHTHMHTYIHTHMSSRQEYPLFYSDC